MVRALLFIFGAAIGVAVCNANASPGAADKTIRQVHECMKRNCDTCRDRCVDKLPAATKAGILKCFNDNNEDKFKDCLTDAQLDSPCVKHNKQDGKGGSRSNSGGKSKSVEIKQALKDFHDCKKACKKQMPKCDEDCTATPNPLIKSAMKQCKGAHHEHKQQMHTCLRGVLDIQ